MQTRVKSIGLLYFLPVALGDLTRFPILSIPREFVLVEVDKLREPY